jgi:D-alanine-D-alanine ligase
MRVAVLHGPVGDDAGGDEKDVLIQVRAVSDALSRLGYEPSPVTFSLNVPATLEALLAIRPDFAFNLVESVDGDGRLIHLAPSVLDHLQIPYTGATTEALFTTSCKPLAKKILSTAGIPTPQWVALHGRDGAAVPPSGVFIIKSSWEHASIGLDERSVVHVDDSRFLLQEMERRRSSLGGDCFAEIFIDGREFNVALLGGENGPQVLPPAEISFETYPSDRRRIVCYKAKWDEGSFEYHHTPRDFQFPDRESLIPRLIDIAERCWILFGLRGYARVDFRVDRQGSPWVLEVNANPCISPDSGFVASAARKGMDLTGIVARIIEDSIPWAGGAPPSDDERTPMGQRAPSFSFDTRCTSP